MSTCACWSWCRDYQERHPPANHHRNCEHYHEETFVEIAANGCRFVCEPVEADAMFEDANDPNATRRDVSMTREQFDAIPDFQGY